MKSKLFYILVLFSQLFYAQEKVYFSASGKVVKERQADYYRVLTKTDDNVWKMERFSMSGALQTEGYALKKNGKEKVGEYKTYYASGELREKRVFDSDVLMEFESYYKSANLKRKSIYEHGDLVTLKDYYDSGQLKNDVLYSGEEQNRALKAKSYYESGALKRDDQYLVQEGNNTKTYKLIKGVCFSEEGAAIPHTTFMRYPEFVGGKEVMNMYIKANFKQPKKVKKQEIKGTVIVRFVVGKNGAIKRAKVIKSLSVDLDKEALRVVNNMPNWTPGMEYGEITDMTFQLPMVLH
ncbi:energy transducer TonB [Formosa haliotis]|uniref:energy transducer TonB n=1 Tax=Formosa haliotis TaxID=1555194 RepID=UPI00082668EB|nr:energy transducer TonB [Formosa haliotis]